jgi:hypothetical protein
MSITVSEVVGDKAAQPPNFWIKFQIHGFHLPIRLAIGVLTH